MLKRPIAQLLAATMFQFYVSIVDPSILAQPLGSTSTTGDSASVNTVASPNTPPTQAPSKGKSAQQQPAGLSGAMQQGATQPTSP